MTDSSIFVRGFCLKVLKHTISAVVIFGWILSAFAADKPETTAASAPSEHQGFTKTANPPAWEKPSWLTDLSLDVKESYDDNIYLSGVEGKFLPLSATVPPGSVAARKDQSSFVTTVSPRIGVNFAPLLGDQQTLQVFSLAYAPDFAVYHDALTESYNSHRFATIVKGNWDSFSFNLDNGLSFIDGSREGPTYPGEFLNAYATTAPRERREQLNDHATVVFQYDHDKWFVRPTASLLYYTMMTKLLDVTGYQNYVDRYDVNGGADFGYRVTSQLAVTLGYRYGHQYQERLSFSSFSSPSNYQRVLAGIEGKPWKWLQVKLQFGPDFRSYPADTATHITPVSDKHPVYYYGEASLTATITATDTFTVRYKQWQWVSQLGSIPYFDSTYGLSYRGKLSDRLTLDLGGSILSSDYTSGNVPASQRDDYQYTTSADLGYSFNAHINAKLTYTFNAGRNAQDGVVAPQTREFDQNVISIAALFTF